MNGPAELLRAMASRIERNAEEEFAGCLIVIPPQTPDGRGGETLELLFIDPQRDPRNFWTAAQYKLDLSYKAFQDVNTMPQLGGGVFR